MVMFRGHRLNEPGDGLVDAQAAALFLTATGSRKITPGQIRVWAHRGQVERHGQNYRGRTLYRLAELQARTA